MAFSSGARRRAHSGPVTSTTIVTEMIAVQVIAWTRTVTDIAESGAIGLPPAGNHSVGRTQILTGQLAAEIRKPVTTKIVASTGGTGARANRRVSRNRAHRESHRRHSQRGCSKSRTSEKAAPRCPMGNHTTQSVDNSSAHRLWRSLLMWKLADDGVPPRAARASGTAVNATKAKPAITPDPSTKPIPLAGWSAMTCAGVRPAAATNDATANPALPTT